ncbi:DALR anticodon-binding domain-containing protein [Streptomyces aidingensis]|uniref:Arginyl-tRNA synthetase n=1 Tax=Streptomyces aidingensis TaxID=910347 RepID=A0A1I1SXG1_9ACTN|nr:DALR anticodon-binding domain-containing protein [Streptomyces aidingensis]SFD51155.1 arginyl-tRNA synthetase [Streptomyces aidingensis]
MTPAELSEAVLRAVRGAVSGGVLRAEVPADAGVRRPPHGDAQWATGIALRLAAEAGRPAREVAGLVRDGLAGVPGVVRAEVAGPGFVNVWTSGGAAVRAAVAETLARPPAPVLAEDPARDVRAWRAAAGGDPAGLLVQREGNPLFEVRYAHARCRALVREGARLGMGRPEAGELDGGAELALAGLLGEWPRVRETARGGAAGVARYLARVADAALRAAEERPPLPAGDEKPRAVHRARLALAQAAGTVLADGLYRLGVSAPDHL